MQNKFHNPFDAGKYVYVQPCADLVCGEAPPSSHARVPFILCNEQNHTSSPDRLWCYCCHSYKALNAMHYCEQVLQTARTTLMFPGPCPLLPQYLLEGKHSRAQAIQEVARV